MILFVIAGGVAGWASTLTDTTTYTTRAALSVLSQNRSPEQDGILAQGYADFFNDDVYQAELRKTAGVADDVKFVASTGLASPLLYVTATSTSRESVASAARAMATALATQVNTAIDDTHQDSINVAQEAFESLHTRDNPPDQARVEFYGQVSRIAADSSNKLRPVQLDTSVSASTPSKIRPIALGLGVGLFLGVMGALVLGALSRRLYSVADVERVVGTATLAVLPRRSDSVLSTLLWTKLRRIDPPLGSIVALVSTRHNERTESVAEGLVRAASRSGTSVLVDLGTITPERPGLSDYVMHPQSGLNDVVHHVAGNGFEVSYGTATGDAYGVLTNPRARHLLERLRDSYDAVIVQAPPLLDTAEGSVACTLADAAIVTIDQSTSRSDDLMAAIKDFDDLRVRCAGVVVVQDHVKLVENRHTQRSKDNLSEDTTPAGDLVVDDGRRAAV